MSTQAVKIVVERFFSEILNRADRNAAGELVAPTFVAHDPFFPGAIAGPDGVLAFVGRLRTAFPDLQYRVETVVAEGDLVAVRWSAEGTHKGRFLNIAPTGTRVATGGLDLFRIDGGRCAEAWVCSDMLGLLRQLGVVPSV